VFSHTLMLLFIMYLRKEAIPSALAIASTLVALFGIALVVELFSARASYNVWGILLSFLAALCSANRLYIYGKQVADSAGEVVGAQAFLVASGFILLFPLLDNMSLPRDTAGHLGVLLACCSMMAGQVFFFTGLKRIGAFETSLMLKAEPVFTCLMSWLILGETWPSLSISVSLLL
jgi:drug/metabolite transporter (DMT)-like permease